MDDDAAAVDMLLFFLWTFDIMLNTWMDLFVRAARGDQFQVFVLLSPDTSEYLHDLMQKKKAKTWSHAILMSQRRADLSLDSLRISR